jgi:hypothetical protein
LLPRILEGNIDQINGLVDWCVSSSINKIRIGDLITGALISKKGQYSAINTTAEKDCQTGVRLADSPRSRYILNPKLNALVQNFKEVLNDGHKVVWNRIQTLQGLSTF